MHAMRHAYVPAEGNIMTSGASLAKQRSGDSLHGQSGVLKDKR